MSRQMKKGNSTINVVEHIMLKNFWEYYVTDNKFNDDIVQCLVMGAETELGDVSLEEIKPYITLRTKDLDDIMPASGWAWVEEETI